jgi:hypothetical protein
MANEIKIAELNIDVSALIKSTAEVKKSIDELKKQQKELNDSTGDNSQALVKNASDLKVLGSEYNAGIKAIAGYTTATAEQENRTQLLSLALGSEVTSIAEARSQNALLNKLRNETNVTTEEGKKQLIDLNSKLDSNNEFIKENADQYLKQKINIGNYSDSIKEALANLNPFNGGIAGFTQRAQEAGGVGNLLKTSLTGVGQGILGVTKASLAFIATPIGAVIAVIGVALGALYSYLKNTQSGIDAVTSVTRPLQAVFSALGSIVNVLGKSLVDAFKNPQKTLQDLSNFVKQNLINRFTAFKDILEGIITLDFKKVTNGVLQAGTGVENLTDKIKNGAEATGKFLDDAVKKGQEIDRLNKQIEKGQLEYNRAQIKTNDLIDEQLLISKDTSKSFAERGKASEEIIRLTEDLGKKEEAIIQAKIKSLQLEYELKGAKNLTNEEQQKMIDLEVQLDESQDRGLNARLEQTRVLSGLKKEAQAKAEEAHTKDLERQQKALDDAVNKSNAQLALFLSEQGIKAKSLEENLKFNEDLTAKKLELAQKEYNASEKTEADKINLLAKQNEIKNEGLKTQTDLVVENAQHELQIFNDTNKSKIDANKFLTAELVAEEKIRLDLIAQEQLDFANLQLENGIINKQAYNEAIKAIDDETKIAKDELDLQAEEARIEKEAIDLENKNIFNQNELATQLAQLEAKKQQEIASAEKTGADKTLIEKKYSGLQVEIKKAAEIAKLNSLQNAFSMAKGLFAENTTAYKLAAIAETTIATYKNAVEAYGSAFKPIATVASPALGAISAGLAVASGLKSVATIAGIKFAGGGFVDIEGNSHEMGGVPIYAGNKYIGEAQGQEGIAIMNKGAFSQFKNFNNTYGDGDVSRNGFMAGGGIITQAVSPRGIDSNELVNATVSAISKIPAPIVVVEDINYAQGNYANVVNGADLG